MQSDAPNDIFLINSRNASMGTSPSVSIAAALPGSSLVSLNLGRLWERCLQRLRPQVEGHIFNAYIASLKFVSFDGPSRKCTVIAPSRFISNYIDQHLRQSMESLIGAVFASASSGSQIAATLVIEVDSSIRPERAEPVWVARGEPPASGAISARPQGNNSAGGPVGNSIGSGINQRSYGSAVGGSAVGQSSFGASSGAGSSSSSTSSQDSHRSFLSPRYTFENFVVGNNSQFVHAAALQVSEQPGQQYNPLFIYGGVGLGKTHLLHAIGNALINSNPSARVLYLSSETFTNELIAALRSGKMDEFKIKLRTIDLLLIDDIQFIAGKERTQEEFFHTFNALYSARKQIVLTADKMPQDMPGIEERLQTRFAWGLAADLQAPDFETRVAIVNKKCAAERVELDPLVAHYIAEHVSSNVRELEGALTRLQAYSSLQKRCIDMSMAELALRPFTQKRAVTLSSEDIKRAVALHFGVKTSEMVSKTRTKSISFPRHVAMFLCRKHTTLSYPEIGGEFGGRDHSSVIHAANVVAGKIQSDQEIRKVVQEIENRLMSER